MAKSAAMKTQRPLLMGTRHMAVAGHHMAAQAAFTILEAGGNAIDAGVAAGLATCVLESERVGLACVAPIMIYDAKTGKVVTIAGIGPWPKAASIDHLIETYGKVPIGPLCTVVPGSPDAWVVALERFGTMSFGEVAATAIRLARDGFPLYSHFAHVLAKDADAFRRWPATAEIFLSGGKPPKTGDIFVQDGLGRCLQYMVDEEAAAAKKGRRAGLRAARDAFYKGDIARTIDAYYREIDGWLRYDDLAAFESEVLPAVKGRFGKADIYACGPWCQGPMLLEILALLDSYDLAPLGANSADTVHLITEAIKLAAADRDAYIGDPNFIDVPLDTLLSPAYIAERRKMIRSDKAWIEMPPPGTISGWTGAPRAAQMAPAGTDASERESANDTSYLCVVDAEGNAFSATPSDGSKRSPVVPGLGIAISSRGLQSWADRDHPSSVAPGKRPRMTPNPAFAIFDDGRTMPFGTPGGDGQTQTMTQVLINLMVFGMDPQSAVEQPRFASFNFPASFEPHHYHPGLLKMEPGIGEATAEALRARGHDIQWWPERAIPAGSACVIIREPDGKLTGGADGRCASYGLGW